MSASSPRGRLSHFVFLSFIDPRRSSPLTFPPSLSLVPYIFLPLPNLFFLFFLSCKIHRPRWIPFPAVLHLHLLDSLLFPLPFSSLVSPPTSSLPCPPYSPLLLLPYSPLLPCGSFAHVADLTIGGFEGSAWRAREKSSGFSGIAQIHRSDPHPFAPNTSSLPLPLESPCSPSLRSPLPPLFHPQRPAPSAGISELEGNTAQTASLAGRKTGFVCCL